MSVAPASGLTAVILTFNESLHIGKALASIASLGAKAFIVDSFSNDATVEIARSLGADVVQHRFVNYAQQFQWALDNLPITTTWVMRLDADEELTAELIAEIGHRLPSLPPDVTGINLNRRHIFLGRWIKHGGRYPLTLLRIWRRGEARIEQRWMDEHMVLLSGRSITFEHDFCDVNLNDLTYFIDKHNKYATREAIDVLQQRYSLFSEDGGLTEGNSTDQASRKRVLKEKLYNRLPFWAGPAAYFFLRFIIQGGFLDGKQGAIYHILQGFWYRFLVGAKIYEFDTVLRGIPDTDGRLSTLERLTGHSLRTAPRPQPAAARRA